jgi:serine/threonine protein kinase
MRLAPGTRVGPYEVIALVGAGGMAEVYRARDTRLGRDVALKVMSEERSISLGDPTGVVALFEMKMTPDGKAIAFDYKRTLGYLFLMDGLNPSRR